MSEHFQRLAFDVRFPSLWTGLETLAWAYAREKKNHELQCPVRLDVVKAKFKELLDELAVPESEKWKDKITKHACVIPVVLQVLDQYGLQQPENRLRGLYDLRNKIAHGHPFRLYSQENMQRLLVLHRILELLILRILGFWREDSLLPAYMDDSILPAVAV